MTKYRFTTKIDGIIEAEDENDAGYTIPAALLTARIDGLRVLSVEAPDVWESEGEDPGTTVEILGETFTYRKVPG